jgi:hypothetical protein
LAPENTGKGRMFWRSAPPVTEKVKVFKVCREGKVDKIQKYLERSQNYTQQDKRYDIVNFRDEVRDGRGLSPKRLALIGTEYTII